MRGIVGKQLHGITDGDVKDAPAPDEAARTFLEWAGDGILVGHNVGFDLGFLKAALADRKFAQGTYLDTLVLVEEAYPDADLKLADLARFFGLETEPTHRALPDAEATAQLLIRLAQDLPPRIELYKQQVADAIRSRRNGAEPAAADKAIDAARKVAKFGKGLSGLLHKKTVRELVLNEGIRMDGRDTETIRPITVEVGLLPRAHGSALFTRGETQALTVATLGPSSDVQRIDTISPEESKRYLHHYNFPPYSAPARTRSCAGPAGATSAMARSPSVRLYRCCPTTRSSRTSSVSFRRRSPRTARPQWRRPVARPSR